MNNTEIKKKSMEKRDATNWRTAIWNLKNSRVASSYKIVIRDSHSVEWYTIELEILEL